MGNRSVKVVGASDHIGATTARCPAGEAYTAVRFGQRAVAQSMAREPGPRNILVAHRMINSGADTDRMSHRILAQGHLQDARMLMNPASTTEARWQSRRSPRGASI